MTSIELEGTPSKTQAVHDSDPLAIIIYARCLVRGGDEPDEEVDHEEDVEGEVDLLGSVDGPGDAGLHRVAAQSITVQCRVGLFASLPHRCL